MEYILSREPFEVLTFDDGVIHIAHDKINFKTKKSFVFKGGIIVIPYDNFIYILERGYVCARYDITKNHLLIDNIKKSYIGNTIEQFINLKSKYLNLYNNYINNKLHINSPQLCTVRLSNMRGHFGHVLTEGFPPLFRFIEENNVKRVFEWYREGAAFYYFLERELFNNKGYNIPYENITDTEKHFIRTCEENLYFFCYSFLYVKRELLPSKCVTNCSFTQKSLQIIRNVLFPNPEIDNICKGYKVVLLVAKTDSREAVNQLNIFKLIINHFLKQQPNVIFLFQGFTKVLYSYKANQQLSPCVTPRNMALKEYFDTLFYELQQSIDDNNKGKLINLNFCEFADYVAYVKHVDLYFSSCGSPQHLAHIFSKNSGVVWDQAAFCRQTQGMFDGKILMYTADKTVSWNTHNGMNVSGRNSKTYLDEENFRALLETIKLN